MVTNKTKQNKFLARLWWNLLTAWCLKVVEWFNAFLTIYISRFLLCSVHKSHRCFQALCYTQKKCWILGWEVDNSSPSSYTTGQRLVGSSWLLIQLIRDYGPHLEAVSAICNRRTRHTCTVTTWTHKGWRAFCLYLCVHRARQTQMSDHPWRKTYPLIHSRRFCPGVFFLFIISVTAGVRRGKPIRGTNHDFTDHNFNIIPVNMLMN